MDRKNGFGYIIAHKDGSHIIKDRDGRWTWIESSAGVKAYVFKDIEDATRVCAALNASTSGGFEIKTAFEGEVIKMPKIHFHALETRTKDELDLFVEKYCAYDFVVYMRYKYDWEKKWNYNFELLLCEDSSGLRYVWENDWDEGQQCVEYIGVAVLDIPINEEIGREDE